MPRRSAMPTARLWTTFSIRITRPRTSVRTARSGSATCATPTQPPPCRAVSGRATQGREDRPIAFCMTDHSQALTQASPSSGKNKARGDPRVPISPARLPRGAQRPPSDAQGLSEETRRRYLRCFLYAQDQRSRPVRPGTKQGRFLGLPPHRRRPGCYFQHSTSTVYARAWAATSLAESLGSEGAVS